MAPDEAAVLPDEVVIRPRRGLVPIDFAELVRYRDLLWFLVRRDISLRYRQTVLGAAWAVLQPALSMALFALIFGRLIGVPSDGVPYPVFVYAGLLPWTYFSSALAAAGASLVGSSNLVTKVYFPRLFIPLGACIAGLLDLLVAAVLLAGLVAWYGIRPGPAVLLLVPLTALLLAAAAGCGLWLSALTVEYRDFRYVVTFLLQLWLFATPVIYPVTVVPERFRWVLALNPVGGLVEAFRAAALGHQAVSAARLGVSAAVIVVILLGGLYYFRRVERSFADVI